MGIAEYDGICLQIGDDARNNSLFSGVAGGTGERMIASSFMKLMAMKVAFRKPVAFWKPESISMGKSKIWQVGVGTGVGTTTVRTSIRVIRIS